MTQSVRERLLNVPSEKIDVVLDTDAYNEIDDQFAISYLLRSNDKLNTVAIYAAPFFNGRSTGPKDGMEKSYQEILKLLDLAEECKKKDIVFKGSERYLPSETEPVFSPASEDLCRRAQAYTNERPLYVVSIGAITNIASALLIDPSISEKIVVVWLGGHAHHLPPEAEFNMSQDVAAARVIMESGVPFIQLPCNGVISEFRISKPELEYWLLGKNPLADYLAKNTIEAAEECAAKEFAAGERTAEEYAAGTAWSRVIWDVTAVAWLLNENNRFMESEIIPTPIPGYDSYTPNPNGHTMRYIYKINRDALMTDLMQKLTK